MDISDLSITGWPFRIALLVLTGVGLLLIFWPGRHHRWRRTSGGVLTVVFGLAFTGAWVNAHFEYFRTVGDLFGRSAADEASVASLSRTDVPGHGSVVTVKIPATQSGFAARPAHVFVPPAWFGKPKPKLPVILMLHGSPGTPEDWTRGGVADQTADAFAAAHDGVAPILVMPDTNGSVTADTECVDSSRGNAETYLTVDVRDFVIQRFETATDAKSWSVAGFSAGGACATMLALRHPDLFETFADYGGLVGPRSGEGNDPGTTVTDLFAGSQSAFDAHEPQKILKSKRFEGMGAWFEAAVDDPPPLAAIRVLAPLTEAAGIDTCLVELPSGGHTFVVWTQAFKDSLPWMAARMGLIPASPDQTRLCQSPR
ncbi:MAG: alpha/beta hydrolase-fold protein [Actinomycetota bacterium]|nr:alpha/beta hydrolase-fold protein [Actinomycetota bacterium]